MKISIVTATWNNAATVGESLASLAAQSHLDIEHVVIDGGSSDGTLALLEQQRERISVLVSERDEGLYDALNKGLSRCSGDVIGFLHADDTLADADALARVARAFEDPNVDACYGDLTYLSARDGRLVRYWRAGEYHPDRLRCGWMPPHPTFYARRSLYDRFGKFDTGLRIAADYDLMLRMLLGIDGRVAYLPHIQVRMRTGGMSNRGFGNLLRKSREDYAVLQRHRLGGIVVLVCKNLSKLGQFLRRPPASNGTP